MRAGLLGLALCCGLALPARAQMDSREGIMLQNQILELRRDMQTLAQRGGGGPVVVAPPRGGSSSGGDGLSAQLLDRVQSLEEQVRRLRGQLDEQANTSRRQQEALSKQIDDMNFRAGAGTTVAPPGPTTQPQLPPRPDAPSPVDARRTPENALKDGNTALARRDYTAAEAAAREVLAAGRTTPRAGDANFLLAQSLFGQRNYQGSAVAYDDAYNRSRTGTRAPDALLGLANALTGLNERPAACATIDKLRREFPSVRGPVRDTAAALRARNGCQ